ncbi:cell wall-binding repeat-containing protein [Microbacterium sp.]|uniref:cell wall-binding repeat-containing protein n=1 Tax=Microbacterium sp. TaxID=51671 RepID=UPI002811E62E|nr:cell wall-binding repeat-containing protein [Microbacterium sp.]
MSVRPFRRACVAMTAALVTALSIPLAAQASTSDDATHPTLDDQAATAQSADQLKPRIVPGPASAPVGGSARSSVAPQAAATPPAQVTAVNVAAVASTMADFEWSAPSDGGSPITKYHLQLLLDGNLLDEVVTDAPIVSATFFDLLPDTGYAFRLAAINAVGTGEFSQPVSFTTTHSSVDRLYGRDRFETSVRVSEDAFPFTGVGVGLVANGLNFPDALAAAAAGGAFVGPVLLTHPAALPGVVRDELFALEPEYVVVPGGTGAVSDMVLDAVTPAAAVGGFRIDGLNRYDTAAQISDLWESADTVFLASGTTYPDALAGAAAAGFNESPVLLTSRDALPAETADALAYHAPSRIVVLGGTGSVSATVANQAKTAAGTNPTVQRLAGPDRYQTAVEISKATFTTPRVPVIYVASGAGFADALAGAAAAGYRGGPVLLSAQGSASAAVLAEIERLDPVRVIVLGGPAAVSDTVVAQIAEVLD